jgi:hypothetical protein
MLRRFRGAQVRRVIDRSYAHVPEHAHDWPVLSIFVMGGHLNRTELDEMFIAGPSVIYPRGSIVKSRCLCVRSKSALQHATRSDIRRRLGPAGSYARRLGLTADTIIMIQGCLASAASWSN